MKCEYPDGTEFKISPLMLELPTLISSIAGRMEDCPEPLQALIGSMNIFISRAIFWSVDGLAYGYIRINTKAIETIWAFTYAHVALYEQLFSGNDVNGIIDLDQHPELNVPKQLTDWFEAECEQRTVSNLPDYCPAPAPNADEDTVDEKAFNIARYALLMASLHEAAHSYVPKHFPEITDILDIEAKCDECAMDWMLALTCEDDRDKRRRDAGISVAMALIVAWGISTGRHDGLSHPKTYDRLISALERFGENNEVAWAVPLTILGGYMDSKGIAMPPGPFENQCEAVKASRDAIAQQDE
jgi:hypothetical protein